MASQNNKEDRLRSVALQNANSVQGAQQGIEQDLLQAKESLERKTQELAQSLAMMRATLESTTDGIVVTDGAGKVTGFNQRYVEMWGIPRELMDAGVHRAILDFCSGNFGDPAEFLKGIDAIYASSPAESSDVLTLNDGRVIERTSRIQFVDGQNVGRVWGFRDITAQRRAQDALREETRTLELLNRTGTIIASTLDLQTLVQTITNAATDLTGAEFGSFFYTTRDEEGEALLLYALSGAPREAFDKFGKPRATELFGPTFRGEGPIRIADVLLDPRYGKMAPHRGMPKGHLPVRSYLAAPVISRSGEVIGGLFFGHHLPGVFSERTERVIEGLAAQAAVAIDNARLYADANRAAEERKALLDAERSARAAAERASVMKDEFLATLSHELRTPLNAILGWAQILSTTPPEDDDLREGLSVIERNARAQTQLIEDLLDMSRIISGKLRLDVQRVDLRSVIEDAVAAVRHSAEAKDIRLQVVLDPAAGPVQGDPNRLQQCFWNLLSNSIKFTTKGGKVKIALSRVNSHLEVCVSDSGQGIVAEFLPYVFERFRQADGSITRRHGGLGLGLSIVKHLIELHGGSIQARSEGEGQGATFTVELPLMVIHSVDPATLREHPRSATAPVLSDDFPSLDGITVLVVDDDPDARQLLRRVLGERGARVLVAATSPEGIELLQRERPDMLLSDIGMPGEDGYALIRKVRQLPVEKGGRTPAAALTAFARTEDRTRALRAGYQAHIAKPVEAAELIALVASFTNRR